MLRLLSALGLGAAVLTGSAAVLPGEADAQSASPRDLSFCAPKTGATKSPPLPAAVASQKSRFALDLLIGAAAGKTEPNVAVSPFGVEAVLAALDLGADAKMKAAIARTLRIKKGVTSTEMIRKATRYLSAAGSRAGGPFATAMGLFVEAKIALVRGIDDIVQAELGIPIDKVDFASGDDIALVNAWVSGKTGGRIPSILEAGTSPSLVAVNAFAFKDCWQFPFDPRDTALRPFEQLDGTTVGKLMMELLDVDLAYGTQNQFVAVELPYGDDRFVLSVVTTTDKAAPVTAFAEAGKLMVGAGLKPTRVRLTMPKFTSQGSDDLLPALNTLGLGSGVASPTHLAGFASGLQVSAILQKTYVAVDEVGTEAAAATAAVATRTATLGPIPVLVKVDKPFVYVLRHRATGSVLIAGYVSNPRS